MAISPEKKQALEAKMESLNIKEEDLVEKFVQGSGKGGQKINKTASCVYLKHSPSGFEVKCQKSRSRDENRFFARRELCEKIENQRLGKQSPQAKEIEKIRKQKERRRRKHTLKSLDNSD